MSSDGGDEVLQPALKPKRRPLNKFCTIFSKSIRFLFTIWGLVFLANWSFSTLKPPSHHPHHLPHQPAKQPVSCSCGGTTVAEAKARGCKFTPLAIAWLPPACLDEQLADEFDLAGPGGKWEYWADLNATIPMTREEVSMLPDQGPEAVFYTTQEWHVMHCMYTWRKHYRSQFTGVTIEARSNGIEHIKHCEKIVRDRHPLEAMWTMAGIELNADLT